MSTIGYSTLAIIPEVKNLRAQLEAQTSRDFAAAGRKGGQQFGDAAGKEASGRIKSHFAGIGRDVFAPVAGLAAGAGIVSLFKGAISGASDLAESGNKVKVIFGDATNEVDRFASRGAKAFGQTELDVLNAASSFGVFGKAAGLSGHDLADFSDRLAGLSTDLASFFNTDPSQAVEAIGAGLRGESEPLRAFGVLLDDATLRQEALRLGLVSTTKDALTPQQRVLAAYNVILAQTKDAQGDFARTSGGLANQQRILSAQWSEMRTELGSKLLPAATAVVHEFNDGVLPAMENTGGVVADAAHAFGDLPAPVKAATGALVAFKVAQATGLTSKAADGFDAISKGATTARQRVDWFSAAYSNARSTVFEFGSTAARQSGQVTRFGATLSGLRAASFGMSSALKGSLAFVGGPWGAAFIAGTAIVAHFWQEHEKAKQRVEDLTEAIKADSGALGENTRQTAINALEKDGVLKAANRLGLSLKDVTDAALGNKDAFEAVSNVMRARGELDTQAAADAIKVKGAIVDTSGAVSQSVDAYKRQAAALGDSTSQTTQATTSTSKYASALDDAKKALQGVLDVENKRRNANLSARQDRLALAEQLQAAREQAAKGGGNPTQAKAAQIAVQSAQLAYTRAVKAHGATSAEARIADEKLALAQDKLSKASSASGKTLDENTKAGQENLHALFDLANQWNNSADSVKNAKGAYRDFREQFVQIAEKMGDSKAAAEKLANQILDLPKHVPVEFRTPGLKAALRDIKTLHDFATERIVITAQATKNRADRANAFAGGGLLQGPGSGTSDSILMWGSNGEFMQRKAAVDYYGVDFMRRVNNLQLPRYAGGGGIGVASGPMTTVTHAGVTINIGTVMAHDYGDFMAQMDRRARRASLSGRRPR